MGDFAFLDKEQSKLNEEEDHIRNISVMKLEHKQAALRIVQAKRDDLNKRISEALKGQK